MLSLLAHDHVAQPFYFLTVVFMAATTYVSLDVGLTISSTLEPGNPKDSLHSVTLFVLTSIWPGVYVFSLPALPYRASLLLTDVNLTQRGIVVFRPNGMDRRRRLTRDAPTDLLRACWYAFYSRTARLLPPLPPNLQRHERED